MDLNHKINRLEPLSGGLRIGIIQADPNDACVEQVVHKALAHEAGVHNDITGSSHMARVLKAFRSNDIQVKYLVAAHEICEPRIIGAALEFETAFTKFENGEFRHARGTLSEDECLFLDQVRRFLKEAKGCSLPQSLGEFFNMELIKHMVADGGAGRIGEYSAHNTTIMRILNDTGTAIDKEQNCPILQLNDVTLSMHKRLRLPVETEGFLLGTNGYSLNPNMFVTSWSGNTGQQQVVASFTKAMSTFSGDPVVRVQITGNGCLPKKEVLKDVLASLIVAGSEEISERGWGYELSSGPRKGKRCPVIPITASREEIRKALLLSSEDEIVARGECRNDMAPLLGNRVPVMRIHALNEPEIVKAMRELGAEVRTLGPYPMYPAAMDFANLSGNAAGLSAPPSRPLEITNLGPSLPMFRLVG